MATAYPSLRHPTPRVRVGSVGRRGCMDVSFLEPLFGDAGHYATVCADVTHTTENADTELDLRVRAVAEKLTEQGAPEAVVEAVRGRLLEGNEGGEAGTWRGREGGAPGGEGGWGCVPRAGGDSPGRWSTSRARRSWSGRRSRRCCRCSPSS